MNRYRMTVTIERLDDVAKNTNPESGKVEPFTWTTDGTTVTIEPQFQQVGKFGATMDGTSYADIHDRLLMELGKAFQTFEKSAPLMDQ